MFLLYFQDRAQVGDRRTFAVSAGDVDDRRQLPFGMIEPIQQAMHALEGQVDALGMQLRQPRDHFVERRWRFGGRRVHA